MPITTGRISWRAGTSNKSIQSLLSAIRTFVVNSGNYTLLTDQITTSNYFVVQSTRNTGFTGDRIIAQVSAFNASGSTTTPYLLIRAYESWSGTTGTNIGTVRAGVASTTTNTLGNSLTNFSLSLDTDIWISCDTTFLLAMSRIRGNVGYNESSWSTVLPTMCPPAGVVAIERLAGDNDPGTFYGHFGQDQWYGSTTRRIYVPSRLSYLAGASGQYLAVGDSAFFNISTPINDSVVRNGMGFFGLDESNSHACFSIHAHLVDFNKIKGRIFGVKVATTGLSLGYGDLLPNSTSPKYLVGRQSWYRSSNTDSYASGINILMEVGSVISPITT